MAKLKGTVASNGATYFYGDINDCRRFLIQEGLDQTGLNGWEGNGLMGMIRFSTYQCPGGTWYAAHWKKVPL